MRRARILVDGGVGWALSAGLAQEGFQVADAGVHLAVLAVLDPGRLAATAFVDGGLEVWRARCDAVLLAARQAIETARASLAVEGGVIAVLVPAEGMTGAAGLTAYLAAAEGVRALVKSLGQAWAPDGVRINCIALEAHVLHHDPNALRRAATPLATQLLSDGHPLSGTTLVAGGGVMAP
jgi:NAD(P)-dependent dehydrogenase (short-subunit alcohol dehydrogenase family)